jgi:probable HAF family extracellular repeat protein
MSSLVPVPHFYRSGRPAFRRLLRFACASVLIALTIPSGAQDYSIFKLPTLGGKLTRAFGINDAGAVVGSSQFDSSGFSHAFFWSKATGIKDLGPTTWVAYAVNNSTQVVGSFNSPNGFSHGFFWTASGGMVDVGALSGQSSANAINNNGQVVGTSYYANGYSCCHSFLWTAANGIQDLDPTGGYSGADGINDNGQVVGQFVNSAGATHAFLWTQAGGMQDLGTLGGPSSGANAINAQGDVIGASDTAAGPVHAFRWTQAGGMHDLGTIPGDDWSIALGINATGQVVGHAWQPNVNDAPFLWTAQDGIKALGPFGVRIDEADGINSSGQLIVSTYGRGYSSRVLTPVYATSTSLVSSHNPSNFGQAVKLTATVTSSGPDVPTGTITFKNGTATIGSAKITDGVAALTKKTLPVGTLSITAAYNGDDHSKKSVSPVLVQVVNP